MLFLYFSFREKESFSFSSVFVPFSSREGLVTRVGTNSSLTWREGWWKVWAAQAVRQLAVPGEGVWGLPVREGGCIMMTECDWETLWFSPLLLVYHVTGVVHQTSCAAVVLINYFWKERKKTSVLTWSPQINFSHLPWGGSILTIFCVE